VLQAVADFLENRENRPGIEAADRSPGRQVVPAELPIASEVATLWLHGDRSMKTRIVRIGNSKGIRIPKPLLDQAGLEGEVDIEARKDSLVIRAARKPRDGWSQAFREMAARGDDQLIDGDAPNLSSWDKDEWEWQ
jgi:antitoxin MazE